MALTKAEVLQYLQSIQQLTKNALEGSNELTAMFFQLSDKAGQHVLANGSRAFMLAGMEAFFRQHISDENIRTFITKIQAIPEERKQLELEMLAVDNPETKH